MPLIRALGLHITLKKTVPHIRTVPVSGQNHNADKYTRKTTQLSGILTNHNFNVQSAQLTEFNLNPFHKLSLS